MTLLGFKSALCALCIFLSFSAHAQDAVPGEFIIRYKSEVSSFGALGKTTNRHNFRVKKSWGKINTYSFKTGRPQMSKRDRDLILDEIRKDPNVLYAEPNYYVKAQYSPLTGSDIKAPESWSSGLASGSNCSSFRFRMLVMKSSMAQEGYGRMWMMMEMVILMIFMVGIF